MKTFWNCKAFRRRKLNGFFLVSISMLLLTAFADRGKTYSGNTTPGLSPLAQYGALVYERENCFNCHHLEPAPDDTKMALTARGLKKPASWYYNLFIHPMRVFSDGRMPGFPHLARQPQNLGWMFNSLPALGTLNKDSLRDELTKDAERITKRLADEGISDEISPEQEVIALIAYMEALRNPEQVIPSTEK